jgi:hypothetical protein
LSNNSSEMLNQDCALNNNSSVWRYLQNNRLRIHIYKADEMPSQCNVSILTQVLTYCGIILIHGKQCS